MNIHDLLNSLAKFDEQSIELVFIYLLKEKKIDFSNISKAYVKYLEEVNEENKEMLAEANTCILQSFDHKKTINKDKSKKDYEHTQRCLYTLNKNKFFRMDEMNEKYKYDEEFAKSLTLFSNEKD